ncbi:FxLYD domain-containing protein [Patescibacteria group bacterium]
MNKNSPEQPVSPAGDKPAGQPGQTKPKPKKLFEEHPEVDKEINRALFMVRHGRRLRVLAIVVVILLVLGLIGYVVYRVVVPPPECTLDEHCQEGYYCHEEKCLPIPVEGPPADLQIEVEDVSVFSSVEGKVDLLAVVRDPDPRWGLQEVGYIFVVQDDSGNEIGRYEGSTYILPAEEKYLVQVGVPVDGEPASATITIEPHSWIKAPEIQQPNIDVKNLVFSQDTNVGTASLDGRLINSSKYNFEEVEVTAILKDSSGQIIGTNYTTLNALIAGEERDFRLLWFSDIYGEVASQDIKVEANVYDTTNFLQLMKSEPEQFQLYEESVEED